ncbi:MAG: KpsF/GutQ family sugar-phosphate isomerase [Alphaproteobacteria bacterium]
MSDVEFAKTVIDTEIKALQEMAGLLDDNLITVLDLMQNAKGRVIVTGMGKAGHIGNKIAATLASTGTPSFFVHPAEASHGDLGMVTNDDVVIAISNSGESKELLDILNYCKRFNIPLIAITKKVDSSLGKLGDYILRLPTAKEACPLGMAPTSSTTSMLAMGDILACCLMNRRAFTKSEYNKSHPGGKLGSVLLKVENVMRTGDDLPFVANTNKMPEAIYVMSKKMLGCVGVLDDDGNLAGMITDGDLRRQMNDELFVKPVVDVMTVNPKTISKDVLAAEAVRVMNEKKITQLFVLEGEKPVGLIHLHDCLRVGVV